ncbi:MAG TPA: alpha/beta fold hydrolase [Aldersonia sp.]
MTTPTLDETKAQIGDGVELEVAQSGEGEPLVLVCGTSQDYRLWAPLLPALAAEYRVIAYNHRGIGASTRGTGQISMTSLAEDLNSLLTELGVERAHVLGWSLGSTVAQEFALAHADRVASLVLAATWGRTDAFQTAVFTGLAHPWRTGDRDAGLGALGIAYSPELLNSEAFLQLMSQVEPLFASTESQIATVAEQWDADLAHDTLDRLGSITAPTLVIAGEQDLLTPPGQGRAVADAIPGARYELFTGPGSSHAALLERTDEFTALVLEYLTEQSLTRS